MSIEKTNHSLKTASSTPGLQIESIIDTLQKTDTRLSADFDRGVPIEQLVRQRSTVVDQILCACFEHFIQPVKNTACCLLAVGGYGRGELLPCSDIDLMLLLEQKPDAGFGAQIAKLLAFLWDTGLEVGHSVRTIQDCIREGEADVTVITNMLESRRLIGSHRLYQKFQQAIAPENIWSSRQFFEAKLIEQQNRHLRYNDTAYNLEPNIKEGPGGLRDIQIIGWVAKRHFGTNALEELVDHEFITKAEYQILEFGQRHLWKVRFALHRLAKRREDRLLFDYQNQLASDFGFKSDKQNLAIEGFMQQYYRTIMELERLNEMLLQIFKEEILLTDAQKKITVINDHFILRNRYIEVRDTEVFVRHPPALVELFLIISSHDRCDGVTASTIRLVREHLYLIDDAFRQNTEVNRLFMQFMSTANGMTHQMRRMNSYGFLAAYIPAFGKITGRMQYDLFHAYTVDQHTLFVIRNLRRFALEKHVDEFPFCNQVYKELENPTLLFLAALFHDIAKGRDGDHSELGAEDAMQFCIQHQLSRKATRTVSQLVRHHLLMSVTAQRKDISNPDVVRDFARQVGSLGMLNCLYLLTVADIRSTNPKLWNNWKDALLKQLYSATKQVFLRGIDVADDIGDIIQENRETALEVMQDLRFDSHQIEALCDQFPGDYFLRHQPLEIKWHVKTILSNPQSNTLVRIRQAKYTRTTKVFVYTDESPYVFSQVTGVLDSLGLSILNAEIFTSRAHKIMDTFIIQGADNEAVTDKATIRRIETLLQAALKSHSTYQGRVQKRPQRQLKSFDHPTLIQFEQDAINNRTIMEISSMDQPGLLSKIARVLTTMNIGIRHAKISTLGERVDDIFYITTAAGKNITDEKMLTQLKQKLGQEIDTK